MMRLLRGGLDISIVFNEESFFTQADSQALVERLRAETDLRVGGAVERPFYPPRPLPSPAAPPDVLVAILYTVAPAARDVFMNVLSSALWDAVKASWSRQERAGLQGESDAKFIFAKRDEEGRLLHSVTGTTNDPDIIKELIRRCLEDD